MFANVNGLIISDVAALHLVGFVLSDMSRRDDIRIVANNRA
jgi:hypothetical protein